ncbi:DUF5362 family protein [Ekhidna sp.]|uniref:DUF5362 family protein n=1 Tax=Ekhidna sp. TaxID=2608089 RepID=UPI003BA89701
MEESDLKLTGSDKTNFLETAKWGKFLSIVGFIMSGFIVLGGLTFAGGAFSDLYPGLGGGIGVFYVLFALIYVFPSLYLYRFSTQIKSGIHNDDQQLCSEAYNNLRRLFLFMGVLMIVTLSLYVLIILFALMGGLMGGML